MMPSIVGRFPTASVEAAMILRPKPAAPSKTTVADSADGAARGPRAPSGTRGWQVAGSPDGTTTLWRRRGRLATLSTDNPRAR